MNAHRRWESALPCVVLGLLVVFGLWGCGRGRESSSKEPLPIEITAEGPVNSPSSGRPTAVTPDPNTAGENPPSAESAEIPPRMP